MQTKTNDKAHKWQSARLIKSQPTICQTANKCEGKEFLVQLRNQKRARTNLCSIYMSHLAHTQLFTYSSSAPSYYASTCSLFHSSPLFTNTHIHSYSFSTSRSAKIKIVWMLHVLQLHFEIYITNSKRSRYAYNEQPKCTFVQHRSNYFCAQT